LGGKRAYDSRLGKDRSRRYSRHSMANANYASPPDGQVHCNQFCYTGLFDGAYTPNGYDAQLSFDLFSEICMGFATG
jgi:hypothetical protein